MIEKYASDAINGALRYSLFPQQIGWSLERLSTYFYDFSYELWSNWLSYLGLRSPFFRQHDLRSAEQGFWCRAEIHVGTRWNSLHRFEE